MAGSAAKGRERGARVRVGVLVLVLAALACAPRPASAPPQRAAGGLPANRALALEVFDRMNAERAARGLPTYAWDEALAVRAEDWSSTMALTGSFRHSDLGASLRTPEYSAFNAMGENILRAAASTTTGAMDGAWMRSEGHRLNMLSPGFTHVGIGVVCTASGQVLVTENFGRVHGATVALNVPSGVDPIAAEVDGGHC